MSLLFAGSTASACTVTFGKPVGCSTRQVLPSSVLAAKTAAPSGAVRPPAFLITGFDPGTPPAKTDVPACTRLVVLTPLSPACFHVFAPSAERYTPAFVPRRRTFGSDGETIIVQYHGAYGTAEAEVMPALELDFDTAPSAANATTNAATEPAATTRLRVTILIASIPRR